MPRCCSPVSSLAVGALLVLLLVTAGAAAIASASVVRITSAANGGAALTTASLSSGAESSVSISGDGRYVAFTSNAVNLVAGNPVGYQVYVLDRNTGAVELVSRSTTGAVGNSDCNYTAISADGRLVFFASRAANLAPNDTNLEPDIFVRDRLLETTERVSLAAGGGQAAGGGHGPIALSEDGRFVGFASASDDLVANDTNGQSDLFVRDRLLGVNDRVTVATDGTQANSFQHGLGARISSDGRFVAFDSVASTLVAGDTNDTLDVFLRDRTLRTTVRVNLGPGGAQANGDSRMPAISHDGRYLAFTSWATNLLVVDTNDDSDVFVWDRINGTLELTSAMLDGAPGDQNSSGPAISRDGRYVTFSSIAGNFASGGFKGEPDVYLRDRLVGTIERISISSDEERGNDASYAGAYHATISDDGRQVLFLSLSSNLAPGDTNGRVDAFVRNRLTGTTTRVNVGAGEVQGVAEAVSADAVISADGNITVFVSDADNLVPGDTNGKQDVFVWNRSLQAIERASISASGAEADEAAYAPAVSADGRFVAFVSAATNLTPNHTNLGPDVFVRDRQNGSTECVSLSTVGNASGGDSPSLSADGRYVAFTASDHIIPNAPQNGVADVFVRDRILGTVERVSVASDGSQADNHLVPYGKPRISADGRCVTFVSTAGNLVPGSPANAWSVFLRDRALGQTELISVNSSETPANGSCLDAEPSANGRFIAFSSWATNLAAGDAPGRADVFVRDRTNGTTELVSGSTASVNIPAGGNSPAISGDGRYVSFVSNNVVVTDGVWENHTEVHLRDRLAATTLPIRSSTDPEFHGPSYSIPASLSGDGGSLAFQSGGRGSQNIYLWRATTSSGAPEPPSSLTASAISATEVRLNWLDNSSNESGFQLQRSTDGGATFPHAVMLAVNSTAYVDGGLASDTVYTYRLRAINSTASSAFSNLTHATTTLAAPSAPSGLAAELTPSGALLLSWTDTSGTETEFEVERSDGDAAFSTITEVDANVETYLDAGVLSNITHTYRVRAVNAAGASPYSNTASGLTRPAPPSGLTVTAALAGVLQLQWVDNSARPSSFLIEVTANDGESFTTLTPGGVPGTSYLHLHLPPAVTRGYRIRATNASGDSAPTKVVFGTTLPNPPAEPTGFKALALSEHSVQLTWNDVSTNETGYELTRSSASGVPVRILLAAGATSFADSGLTPNTSYRYDLVAVNARGASPAGLALVTTLRVPVGKLSVVRQLSFGNLRVGATRNRTLKLRNLSRTAPLRVILTAAAAPFSLKGGAQTLYLREGETRTVEVHFTPTARGNAAGALNLTTSSPAAGAVTVKLKGKGK